MAASNTPPSDVELAVASLATRHQVLDPLVALEMLHEAGGSDSALAAALLERVGASQLLEVIAGELGLAWVDLHASNSSYKIDEDLVRRCSLAMLKDNNALPLRGPGEVVAVAMADPRGDQDMIDYLTQTFGERPAVVMAPASAIQARLVYFDGANISAETLSGGSSEDTRAAALPTSVADNPVIEWVDNLLSRAATEGASDVKFLFDADGSLRVHFRIDSVWHRQATPLRRRENEIVSSLLNKCETIDASDKRRPQDGTFSFAAAGGRRIDARLAMLPQEYGATVVIRLLDPANINKRLDDMGFAPATLAQMRRVVRAPQGAAFFIGPTGSGKTTTLYGLLKELPAERLNILTAEDPVEYRLPGIGQTQIRSGLGEKSLTFAHTLRAMLRLAPDVLLVGEIRDDETAEMAMHAAMTGHMVLSTLHAKSALGAYARLEGLGVDSFVAGESLSLAVNQRLIRRVHDCAAVGAPTREEAAFLQAHSLPVPDQVPRPRADGCPSCNGTGYRGRLAVVEVLEPSPELRTVVAEKAPIEQVEAAAFTHGYTSLLSDAHRHVVTGLTSVAELQRCIDTGGK